MLTGIKVTAYISGSLQSGIEPISDPVASLTATPFYSTVKLTWTKNSNASVRAYKVYRKLSTDANYPSTPVYVGFNSDNAAIANPSEVLYNDYNLQPGTSYKYKVIACTATGSDYGTSSEITTLTTTDSSNLSRCQNLKILFPIYNLSNPSLIINSLKKASEFYYRNSYGKLNLQPVYMIINSNLPANSCLGQIDTDLSTRGVFPNQYDLYFASAEGTDMGIGGGHGGGSSSLVSAAAHGLKYSVSEGMQYAALQNTELYADQVWMMTHEIGHSINRLVYLQHQYMSYNHFPWSFTGGGANWSVETSMGYDMKNTGYNFTGGENFDGMECM